MIDKKSIGQVFISHSSKDKSFVRKLSKRLTDDGFRIWLDEKELLVGDSLPTKISDAVNRAMVVLIVVSSAALKSRWLSFELNKATNRMIQGECRVIPLVIEKIPLPAEVEGLLYADFTTSFAKAYRSLSTSLIYEAAQSTRKASFYMRADAVIDEVFDGRSYGSMGTDYSYLDYEAVELPFIDNNGNEFLVVYESVQDYLQLKEPLSEMWLKEFLHSKEQFDEDLFLIISERPIGYDVTYAVAGHPRVKVKQIGKSEYDKRALIAVDLSDLNFENWPAEIRAAKEEIVRYGKDNSLFLLDDDMN